MCLDDPLILIVGYIRPKTVHDLGAEGQRIEMVVPTEDIGLACTTLVPR